MESLAKLLPDSQQFQLQKLELDPTDHQINLMISSVEQKGACPVCDRAAHRIHSRYVRKLLNLPWANYRILITLRARKFFCDNQECSRRIFTERFAGLIKPWTRRTQRLNQYLVEIALRLGGRPGAALSQPDFRF